jgi:uncharacterized membrane protein YgdD (TMEM256/DUF423 family)
VPNPLTARRRQSPVWLALGALNGLLAVAGGAFAAHALAGAVDERALAAFRTGADYHTIHALALLAVAALSLGPRSAWLTAAGSFFVAGILLFSGSLYVLALTGARAAAFVTPFGGTAFLLGWSSLLGHAVAVARSERG